MNERILIVEDEDKIARVLELELTHEGYSAARAADGEQGLALALDETWDLILLDIMLPKMGGFEVLKKIREADNFVPIILLTARNSVPEKVEGLDSGANDYVTKPFSIEELLARIRNLLRLSGVPGDQSGQEEETCSVGDLTVDPKTQTVRRGDKTIELTPREYDLLLYLIRHKGAVLSRENILSDVWGFDFMGDTNLVDVYIRYLRQKIDVGFKKNLIHTRRGVGYLIKEPSP
ncbi:response regulator transcription factor [Ferviditalea candida]|uniref:Response regulator transcription factor n=1 Tax=Ferviditalea candida TaxID=3108399 RepID=A0ABU5ZFS5_9BACL|nr:response regulator transcription factor [Paenibacillaceae bacterium T2]